jgi:hypothetical protein
MLITSDRMAMKRVKQGSLNRLGIKAHSKLMS